MVRWLFGLGVALVVGGIVTWIFLAAIRRYLGAYKPAPDVKGVPAWLTGVIERLFFALVIAFNITGAAIAMIGWLTLKMVTNWNRPGPEQDRVRIVNAFAALLAGIISMLFAMVGGLIIRGDISW